MLTIHPIRLPISNAFLICGERPVLVDTGAPSDSRRLFAALDRARVDPRDLALILHTHAHYDHAGCTHTLHERAPGVPVAIQASEREALAQGVNAPIVPVHALGRLVKPLTATSYHAVTADLIIESELDLAPYGIAARVIHTPGHTPGSLSILTDAGDAIIGDLLGGGLTILGRIAPRRPRRHYFATDQDQLRASIRRILQALPRRIYVGHGGPQLAGNDVKAWFERLNVSTFERSNA